MDNYTLINKKFVKKENSLISIDERGFRYGDGIFETCKIIDEIIYDYESHLARIINGLKALEINYEIKNLQKNCYELIKKNKIKNGILRISISRGIGSIGYLPKNKNNILEIIEAEENKLELPKNIRLGISKIKLWKRPTFLRKAKTKQSLNYILAKISAEKNGNFDDILLNEKNYVGECSSSNIFWIKNNKIFTPSFSCDILDGTIRKKILQKFPQKINLTKARISTLLNADEVFITNSNFLILPIDEIIFHNKKFKFKKIKSLEILDFIKKDIKKYIRYR